MVAPAAPLVATSAVLVASALIGQCVYVSIPKGPKQYCLSTSDVLIHKWLSTYIKAGT